MLDHLRQRVADALASARTATLSTTGPATLQAGVYPCQAEALSLWMLVPQTSDHLFNIENLPEVVVTTDYWQLRGSARIVPARKRPTHLDLLRQPTATGCEVVEVVPVRMQFREPGSWGAYETIDL